MTKEEFLEIFDLTEMYEQVKDMRNSRFSLSDYLLYTGTYISFYFRQDEISMSFTTKDFVPGNKERQIFLKFNLKNNQLLLNKDHSFKNELFEHLFFEEGIVADLEFLAGIIKNILTPKYNLRWRFSEDY